MLTRHADLACLTLFAWAGAVQAAPLVLAHVPLNHDTPKSYPGATYGVWVPTAEERALDDLNKKTLADFLVGGLLTTRFDPLTPESLAVRALCPWWNEFPLLRDDDSTRSRAADRTVRAGGSLLDDDDPTAAADDWSKLGFQTDERRRRKASRKTEATWGELSSSVVLFDAAGDARVPASGRGWSTQESLKVPLAQRFFVYGQVGAASDAAEASAVLLTGKTGIGVRWEPVPDSEVQLRTGQSISYGDSELPMSAYYAPAESQLAVELLAKTPLVGPLRLEYTGTALPARVPTEPDKVNQDLRVALPMGKDGSFHVGARYRWENALTPTPWVERTEVYMGLSLKR